MEEAFAARRPAIRLLVVPHRRMALEKIVLHATSLRIPIVEVEGGTLTSLAGFDGHQGVALVVGPRRFATMDDVFARAGERGEPPFVLVLDSLEDPQNVGTLLRSAEAVGAHGVLFPTHRQAPLSPAAVKASAGAVEHLLLVPVDDLPGALADLHVRGLRVAGADGDASLAARSADLRGPIALVIGSEGQGLGPAVRRRVDFLVRIPMRGHVGSINAAVAGSVLLFEVLAQRDPTGSLTAVPLPLPPVIEPQPEPPAEASAPAPVVEAAPKRRTTRTKAEPAEPAEAVEAAESVAAAEASVSEAPISEAPPKRRTTRKKSEPAEPVEAQAAESVAAAEASVSEAPVSEAPPKPRAARKKSEPAEAIEAPAAEAAAPDAPPKRRSTRKKAEPVEAVETQAAEPPAQAPIAEVPPKRRATRKKAEPAAAEAPAPAKPKRAPRPKAKAAADDADTDLLPGGPTPSSVVDEHDPDRPCRALRSHARSRVLGSGARRRLDSHCAHRLP